MPSLSRIGPDTYSIAHYGQQNGDLMADPEMTFRGDGTPLTYRNDYVGAYTGTCDVEVRQPLDAQHRAAAGDQAVTRAQRGGLSSCFRIRA